MSEIKSFRKQEMILTLEGTWSVSPKSRGTIGDRKYPTYARVAQKSDRGTL